MIKSFEAKIRYQPGMATIDLHGELTVSAGEALDQAYTEAERCNPEIIRLNFGGVNYLNSTGIALLIGLLIRARQTGRFLIAYGLSPICKEIFELSRLTEFIQIYADEAATII